MTQIVGVVLLVGCYQVHVDIEPLPPNLTPEQRVAIFEARAPVSRTDTTIVNSGGGYLETSSLRLADRTIVEAPEDLGPLVMPTSETARAAGRSVTARHERWATYIIAAGAFIIGGLMTGILDSSARWDAHPLVGWGLIIGAPVLGYPLTRWFQHVESRERRAAYEHYPRDLGDRLNVCAHELKVIPCEAPSETNPPAP